MEYELLRRWMFNQAPPMDEPVRREFFEFIGQPLPQSRSYPALLSGDTVEMAPDSFMVKEVNDISVALSDRTGDFLMDLRQVWMMATKVFRNGNTIYARWTG